MEIDDRYQLCKICGAKDCDCTMRDALIKIERLEKSLGQRVDTEI